MVRTKDRNGTFNFEGTTAIYINKNSNFKLNPHEINTCTRPSFDHSRLNLIKNFLFFFVFK